MIKKTKKKAVAIMLLILTILSNLLPIVPFDILDEKGNILETITTNEKGEAYTSRYAIRDYSKLTI